MGTMYTNLVKRMKTCVQVNFIKLTQSVYEEYENLIRRIQTSHSETEQTL